MATATLPHSAEILTKAERPSLSQLRQLRRVAEQSTHERPKLVDLFKGGLPGIGDDDKSRAAGLAYALGFAADVEDLADGSKDAYLQAVLGMAYASLGDADEAKALLTKAAKSLPEATLELARVCLDADDVEGAQAALDNAENGAEKSFLEGRCHEQGHSVESAISAYEVALEQETEHAEAAFKLGVLLDRIGDDDMAVEYYTVCSDVWPHYLPGVINLGILFDERGEANAAIDCFRQVLAHNEEHRRARMLLRDAKASRTMYYDEREEREREHMEKIMKTSVNDFELSVRSRNCLAKMNIFTLGDLVSITEQEMLNYKNFGETSLKEVKEMLTQKGLRLGMNREHEDRGYTKSDQKTMAESIEKLELSSRTQQLLERLGCTRIGDVLHYTDLELYRAPGAGQSMVQELSTALGACGLHIKKPDIRV